MSLIWLHGLTQRKRRFKPVPLKDVHVASPCPLRWEQMVGNERVRHCSQCNLNVYNLSALTAQEAEDLIASREGRLCVRFYQRPDGTILTRDCPVGLGALVRRVSRVAGTALSALLSVSFAAAQAAPKNGSAPATRNSTSASQDRLHKATGIALAVVYPEGDGIPDAHVILQSQDAKMKLTGTTNSEGKLYVHVPVGGSYTILVKSPDFKSSKTTLSVSEGKIQVAKITLRLDPRIVVLGNLHVPEFIPEPIHKGPPMLPMQ